MDKIVGPRARRMAPRRAETRSRRTGRVGATCEPRVEVEAYDVRGVTEMGFAGAASGWAKIES